MAASRRLIPHLYLAFVWLALVASCGGRSALWGITEGDAGDTVNGNAGDDDPSSGGAISGRGGRRGMGGDEPMGTGGRRAPGTGGSTTGSGGDPTGSGATGPSSGGSISTGGSAIATGGNSISGATSAGGTDTGGVSGVGAEGGTTQAGTGGTAGEPNIPGVKCGGPVCDARDTCCVGLTETACLPEGTECNGAVLHCSAPSSCGGDYCCLTMGGGMATADCTDSCSNSFDGSGRVKLRLCESDADCTNNRECRMTFVGVSACMRRP